ncbi:MAG: hypothetical protein F4Z24_05365 [Nitrospira sp. SB0666_bin_27]|nr:hypothetical protein [Nitrospira sp. SB0666_bin_27]MYC28073.1 hypothetical protein [Nitrospira sp. SB0662_bin_26]MYF25286.1 hypothetical protein [Nitrospira sp. SB0678_bin_10]
MNQPIFSSTMTKESIPSQNLSERRCLCGQLLARLGPRGLELKCKRCGRVLLFSSLFSNTRTSAAPKNNKAPSRRVFPRP